jgi:hypothetical protein
MVWCLIRQRDNFIFVTNAEIQINPQSNQGWNKFLEYFATSEVFIFAMLFLTRQVFGGTSYAAATVKRNALHGHSSEDFKGYITDMHHLALISVDTWNLRRWGAIIAFSKYRTEVTTWCFIAEEKQVSSNFNFSSRFTIVSTQHLLHFDLRMRDYKDWTIFCGNFLEMKLI